VEAAQKIRGYGHVKQANYLSYQVKLKNMMQSFKTGKLNIHAIKVEVAEVA